MADVGTLAAASVARRLGIRTVFTCAPDPHGPIAQRQASGSITRENFGTVDSEEHLWFRARMVERLVGQADHLVLFPRRDVSEVLESVMGIDRAFLDQHSTIAPDGIDLDAIDAAARRTVANPAGSGVVLLGARQPSTVAQVLVAAAHGAGTGIAPHGVYANGAAKEEFGLAVLEALAAGLPVVAPEQGGPATYVDVDVTGVLVAADDDLAPAMLRALSLHGIDARAAAARDMIAERYTVSAYADALLGAYRASVGVGASSP